jgi:hypothetical protein
MLPKARRIQCVGPRSCVVLADDLCGARYPNSLVRWHQASTSLSFYDAETACIIVLIRSARLTLLVSMLQYYDEIMQFEDNILGMLLGNRPAWQECGAMLEQDVIRTIDDILASVPYVFGDIDPGGDPVGYAVRWGSSHRDPARNSSFNMLFICHARPDAVG